MKGSPDSLQPLPIAFLNRMSANLGDEYDEFLSSLSSPPVAGLRVNTIKISTQEFRQRSPYPLSGVPWCASGYIIEDKGSFAELPQPGQHVYQRAGLYYLQEPSAMAAAEILAPRPGERVLDLAAAPGGKTTHMAALMKNTGVLFANEIHPKRVWDLAENLERCGVTNAIITNETPSRLADHFGTYFDRVMLDAPCSGEGMFRKNENARREWTEAHVISCALRQAGIFEQAARLVRPGGCLVYTTCTFSGEENEGVVSGFLAKHPDFDLQSIQSMPGYSPGRPAWIHLPKKHMLNRCVRIWPHRAAGEGHFIALLTRTGDSETQGNDRMILHGKTQTRLNKERAINKMFGAAEEFFRSNLEIQFKAEQLSISGTYLYDLPIDLSDLAGLKVIHPGWWLGSFKQDRFIPSHALALGIDPKQAREVISFDQHDSSVKAYLAGSNIPNPGNDGWILVCLEGFPLGWGKRVKGTIKNYYPRGLRNHQTNS